MTMQEHFTDLRKLKVAWIGDGNNVCNSLILSTPLTGMNVVVAAPPSFSPEEEIITRARSRGGTIQVTHDPLTAAKMLIFCILMYGSRWEKRKEVLG
jgi:ornithine carbamoyltransferase